MPIGPKGLVPSARLLALAGQRVRVIGNMARQDVPSSGIVILAPLPVTLGDEDESFSDDLPATALYMHLAEGDRSRGVPWMPGLLTFTGVLQLGAMSEVDGRMSFVHLQLDTTMAALQAATATPSIATLRDAIVGTYQASKFPKYAIAPDGYTVSTDVDFKMLIGYTAPTPIATRRGWPTPCRRRIRSNLSSALPR